MHFDPPAGRLPEEADDLLIGMRVLQTIEEWGMEPGMPVVVDPDGFKRDDDRLLERYFTEEEYLDGAMMSTVLPAPEMSTIFPKDVVESDLFDDPWGWS